MPSFADLTDAFLDAEFSDSPVRASSLGLTEYDDRLDDLSEATFERRRSTDAEWLERFRAVGDAELTFDEGIDRDLVISILRGRQIVDDFEVWRRQPDTYLNPGMSGIFGLFLHRLRPIDELVDSAIARLALIPENLEDGKRNLRPEMVPAIFLDRAANQARAGARYVREILPAQIEDERLRTAWPMPGRRRHRPMRRTSPSSRRCDRRRPATTCSARSGIRRCCARRRCSASTLASSASEGVPPTTSWRPS